jgi:hypothetical protein
VLEAAASRLALAWEQGHDAALRDRLDRLAPGMAGHASFWLYRALSDRHAGSLTEAANALARGWQLVSTGQFVAERGPLAVLAAAVFAEMGEWLSCANWLAEAALAMPGTVPVAGWCRWLAAHGQPQAAQQLQAVLGIGVWQRSAAVAPPWPVMPAARARLTVCLVDDGRSADQSLPMSHLLADDLLVVAPQGSDVLTAAAGYAATCVAMTGLSGPAVDETVTRMADGDWLLLVLTSEWSDAAGTALIRRWLAAEPAPQAVAVPIHVAGATDPGQRLCRLAPLRQVRRIARDGDVWWLEVSLPQTEIAGVKFWRLARAEGVVS